MDSRLRHYYNRELRHLRETALEFAQEFPKIAGRLGMDTAKVDEPADPYVERLLEGFAFLTARVQLKLDAEFPRFTQGILETVYPHYLAPTPSMAIVRFNPDLSEGALAEGFKIPRDRSLRSTIGKGDSTACEYRTAHDVTMYPIEVAHAEYLTRGLGALNIPDLGGAKAGIRLRLRATAGQMFNQIKADSLVFHIHGVDETPMRIYEQILAHTLSVVVQPTQTPPPWRTITPGPARPAAERAGDGEEAVARVGFNDDEALLPYGLRSFHGYRLLQEYFTLPQRFLFTRVGGLAEGFAKCKATEIDVVLLLKEANLDLENAVSAENFLLNCTPAINLFPKRADRIHVSDRFQEFNVIPDRTRPLDFEVYQVLGVTGYAEGSAEPREFKPFYAASDLEHDPSATSQAYFSVNRVPRMASERERQMGRRSSYAGSEVYVSLVDAKAAPWSGDLRQLAVETRCTNRDLPLRMPVGRGKTDFTMEEGAPVESIRCITGPTGPRPSHADGETAWRIISHLSLNYLSLTDTQEKSGGAASGVGSNAAGGGGGGGAALRELLKLYGDQNDPAVRKQIEGVKSVSRRAIVRRVQASGPVSFARGLEIQTVFDESAYEGTGVFVLGAVFEQFFAKYVSLNSFTETVVRSQTRGEIMRWPARPGRRELA